MNYDKISRRQFLKLSGVAPLVIVSAGLVRLQPKAGADQPYSPDGHFWGFGVDPGKCIGCGKCVLACKQENHVPFEPDSYRTWMDRYVITQSGQVLKDSPDSGINGFQPLSENPAYQGVDIKSTFFVPKLCNQCQNPPCVPVCPVKATYTTEDGVVLVDESRCIGCKYCIVSCPYGVRYLHPVKKVADKCTFCYHRIAKGLLPACVQVCPTGARFFGDLRDPKSPVANLPGQAGVQVLKPGYGTKPKVYYVNLPEGVN